MGAFDRLQNYSSKRGISEESDVFDVKTPKGAFLNRVHREGFKLYETTYALKPEYLLSDDAYMSLSDQDKESYDSSLELSETEYEAVENKDSYEKSVKFTELHDALTCTGNQTINAVAGSGKALKNGTGVVTPNGFVPIESLKVGDLVASDDGNFYNVTGVFPQGLKDAYEVRFSDGNTIVCSGDHLWNVWGIGAWETKTTLEIQYDYLDMGWECEIPNTEPVDFGCSESVMNPFLYGMCLSRGTCVNGKKIGFHIETSKLDWLSFALSDGVEVEDCGDGRSLVSFQTDATYCDHIYEPYLRASVGDRYMLLTGLLINAKSFGAGRHFYHVKSEQLADDIVMLCESLGTTVTRMDNGLVIMDGVVALRELYGLRVGSKEEGFPITSTRRPNGVVSYTRSIVAIENLNTRYEMTCISVDSPNHLFLTEHFIPTHNTTALTFKILYDIVTGEAVTLKSINGGTPIRVVNNMWVCTFLKSGSEELAESLAGWQRKLGYSSTVSQINFSTMDAEFKRCLNAMGVATPIADGGKLSGILRKAVDSCGISRRGSSLSKEDYQIIGGIVTYYRGRLDDKRYQHPSCKDYDLTRTILDLLVKQFATLRQQAGVMDFEEIMELLYKYLYETPNPAVQDFVANRYNYIYVDEFQDTSQMAYAILKFYARGKLWMNRGGSVENTTEGLYTGSETIGKLVVVGDVSQCIYSFRGSDSKVLSEFVDHDFRPTISTLSINWRCPSNILSPVVSSIHQNEDSAKQVIKAARKGGEFKAYCFSSYKSMIAQLKTDIAKDMEDSLNVAILCRTNFDGLIPAFILEADGRFNFSVSGENMTLNSPLPRKIIGVSSLFTERSSNTVKTSLEFFAGRGSSWNVKQLVDTLKMNNRTIWNLPIADIQYSCPHLAPFINRIKPIFMDSEGNRDKSKELEALRTVYALMILDVFDGDSAYCESARAYLETLIYIIDNNNFASVYAFLEEIEYLNDKLNGRIRKKNANIRIATVHEFKGKECDSVYVWNDSDGTFPSSKCDLEDVDQLNEERRVHYIACTRARKREHIYSLQSKVGMFAKEMDCTFENPIKPASQLPKH